MKLTELVKQWRSQNACVRSNLLPAEAEGMDVGYDWREAIRMRSDCADDLESLIAEHMTWVQIAEDESTWPDSGQDVMLACWYDGWVIANASFETEYANDWLCDWWRPLNDNDRPPQEVK